MLSVFEQNAWAQSGSSTESHPQGTGYTVKEEELMNLRMRAKKISEENPVVEGFRVQLYSSSGAESFNIANNVQSEFLKIYPELPCYVVHQKPSFKVRVGDYRQRIDAERFLVELKEKFPDAFIVKDAINLPALYRKE